MCSSIAISHCHQLLHQLTEQYLTAIPVPKAYNGSVCKIKVLQYGYRDETVTNTDRIDHICALVNELSGTIIGSTRGYYGCNYILLFYDNADNEIGELVLMDNTMYYTSEPYPYLTDYSILIQSDQLKTLITICDELFESYT